MTRHDAAAAKMAALFDPEPEVWGLRGDPYVWRTLRDRLAGTDVPPTTEAATALLRAAFAEVVGVDLDTPESSVYREQYAHGGMSSGVVHLDTWRERLMPMLVERAGLLARAA
ncbi:hypothetical protein ACFY7C_17680 [Streptomyces sp. NPDC012769]|uniref:hypothetical protein n=1 Tax=Streptomyces sp. NPDC012769 TaxID=3364848 RepID=UPI0036B7EEFA